MIFKTSTSPLPSSASMQTRVNEDAEEAVNLCRESLRALPSQHPDMYLSYVRLQEIYLSRYQVQHNLTELSLAADNFRLASTPLTQAFPYRIITAWNWVTAAERQSYICARGLQQFRPYLAARSSTISRCEVAAAAFSCVISLPSNSWSRVAAGTLWEADDAAAKYVVKVFYENMFKDLKDGCFMDCTKAAWAHAVKTKALIEQRMFIHIGSLFFILFRLH
ncbi:hypothetical protein EV424DRAFT_1345103 [Suillus variegatus]|nr:hypothetical protein EV424DRAFT_1345103 [Suillus variegatus]